MFLRGVSHPNLEITCLVVLNQSRNCRLTSEPLKMVDMIIFHNLRLGSVCTGGVSSPLVQSSGGSVSDTFPFSLALTSSQLTCDDMDLQYSSAPEF